MSRRDRHVSPGSCLLWPFVALFRLIAGILVLGGRFLVMVLGMVLIFVGVLVSLTIVGAVIGIPLALVGLLLVFRGLS
jgi:hypothetical protein